MSLCSRAQLLALEPKFIERNVEPLLEDPSGTLCCSFATLGQGWTAAQAGQHRISKRCAPI